MFPISHHVLKLLASRVFHVYTMQWSIFTDSWGGHKKSFDGILKKWWKWRQNCQTFFVCLDFHLPLSIDNDQHWWRGISTEWEDSGVSTRESHQPATEPCANKSHTARSNPSSIAICKPAARLPLQQVQFTRAWEQPLWLGKRWLTRRLETNTASSIRQSTTNDLPRFFQFKYKNNNVDKLFQFVHSKWQDRAYRTAEWLISQVFVLSFFNFTVDQ